MSNLFKCVRIVSNIVFDLIFKDKKVLLTLDLFLAKILDNFFKIQSFLSKNARNRHILSTLIKFAERTQPKATNTISVNTKRASPTSTFIESALELTFCRFLLTYLEIIKTAAFIFNF